MKLEAVLGIDSWLGDTEKLINDELSLSIDTTNINNNIIEYPISDSDTFSRVYSKINKSTEFTYIDNESFYEDTQVTLVYEIPGGKAKLYANLQTDNYILTVERS